MADETFDPVVAFGLKALTLCLKAKGNKCTLKEAERLVTDAQQLLPFDEAAASAVTAFVVAIEFDLADQSAAAAGLDDFLTFWRHGAMRERYERTETNLRQHAPEHFDWQDRKDCGNG